MKKLMMTLCAVAILALPGCCCKRSDAPKAKTHKKHVVKKHHAKKSAHKKHVVKKHKKADQKKKHKKHVHIELDNTDALFA